MGVDFAGAHAVQEVNLNLHDSNFQGFKEKIDMEQRMETQSNQIGRYV